MLKQMIILRGLPSSGKSTLAQRYKERYHNSCVICSTDDYWLRPDGTYDFNYNLLDVSHAWNQQRVKKEIIKNEQSWGFAFNFVIVIDNTNTTFEEMEPYIKIALDYELDIKFKEPNTWWKYNVEECYHCNTHRVPYATILKMYQRFESEEIITKKLAEYVEEYNKKNK